MVTELDRKPMSVDEWLEYDVPEGYRAELVHGELVMNPVPDYPHQKIVFQLYSVLIPYRSAHPELIKTIMSPARMVIPDLEEGREPDMALYAEEPSEPDAPGAWKRVKPFLVVEIVSPGQGRRDYIDKWTSYHRAEIPEYWIIDYVKKQFTALRWTPERWEEQVFQASGAYRTPRLPDFELSVERLWI